MTCVSSTPSCELESSPALSRDRCSSAADKLVTNSSTRRTVRTSCRSPSTPHRQPLNPSTSCSSSKVCLLPRAGSRVVGIDPLRFLAECRTRRLNQALSVLSLSLDFLSMCVCVCVCVVLLTRFPSYVVLICVNCVFCLLVVLVRLSQLVTDMLPGC